MPRGIALPKDSPKVIGRSLQPSSRIIEAPSWSNPIAMGLGPPSCSSSSSGANSDCSFSRYALASGVNGSLKPLIGPSVSPYAISLFPVFAIYALPNNPMFLYRSFFGLADEYLLISRALPGVSGDAPIDCCCLSSFSPKISLIKPAAIF